MWSAFVVTALARPTVVELAAPVDLDLPGRHARPFVDREGAWRIGFGRSGSFHSVPWDGTGVSLDAQRTHVMLGDGVDHGWVSCPDGGFLHVASRNSAALDDSAIATRLDAALRTTAQRVVVSESSDLATNDMAVVCGLGFAGVAFAERGIEGDGDADGDVVFRLDDDFFSGGEPEVLDISESTRVTGNTLLWDEAQDRLLSFGLERDLGMLVAAWDGALQHEGSTAVEGPPPPLVGWWAQGAVALDDHWLVVHMQGNPDDAWGLDTGDVALLLLDNTFGVVERHVLTSLAPPNGAMRPALAVHDNRLLVSFDTNGAIQVVTGRIDRRDEEGSGGDDPGLESGAGDSDLSEGPAADSGAAATRESTPPRCGCRGTSGAAVWFVGVVALWMRRRLREAPRES